MAAGILSALAIVDSIGARVSVLSLGTGIGLFGWLTFRMVGKGFWFGLMATCAILCLTGLSLVVTLTDDEDRRADNESGDSLPTSSPSTSDEPSASQSSTPTGTNSSTGPSESIPALPTPARGKNAPLRVVGEGQSTTVFGSKLLIGIPSVYDSFVSLVAQTDFDSCDAAPNAGQTAVLAGSEQAASVGKRVWYRIALLGIDGRAATLRVERLIAENRPTSTAYSC